MLAAVSRSKASIGKGRVSQVASVPAPTGGINAQDGYTSMGPADAVKLDNWFPEAQYVVTRNGTAVWKSGMGGPVRSLMVWYGTSGTDKMIAATGTSFWDVSLSGGSASAVVTGLTNADWQWTNCTTSGGTFLVCCNGADSVHNFDGTTWTTPVITGATSSTLINVMMFKQRLWFVQKNTLSAWYMPTSSIAGAATEFPLGAVFRHGGYIIAMGTFSRDSGDGPDDYLAIATSNGEVAVYEGIDPTSSSTFGLNGVFSIGRPIGRRCMGRLNGDLTIITSDGVLSMQSMLQYGRESDQKAAITSKIQTLFSEAANSYSTYFGWQIAIFHKARYCIVNYPVVADTQQLQFVMNTVTGSWCTFSNLNAGCWASANDKLFYGGNTGIVYQAATGNADVGADIACDMKTAWRNFDIPEKKIITAIKPILLTGGGVDYQHRINWDFDDTEPSGTVTAIPVSGGVWGSLVWPWTWGGNNVIDAQWHTAGGVGTWAAVRFKVAVNGTSAQINAFSVLLQRGGAF